MIEIGRRDALRMIGAAPLAVYFGVGAAQAEVARDHAAEALSAAAKGQSYTPKFFTAHEWETVRVLVDLILPRDERSGSATDAGVPEFMDFLMSDPEEDDRARESRQTGMRGGLAWIDSECRRRFGRSFLEGSDAEHRSLLDEIAYAKESHGSSFFAGFRDLTASGFWSSEMGVEDLGYVGNKFAPDWQGPPPEILRRLGIGGTGEKP